MADGDIIHGQPRSIYRKPYKELCEGKFDLDQLARNVMGVLLKDIKHKGNELIDLAKRMGEYMANAIEKGEENFAIIEQALEKIVNQREFGATSRDKHIVLNAGKMILHAIRYEEKIEANNLPEAVVQQYIKEVYQSSFEAPINSISEHYASANSETLNENLKNIRTQINEVTQQWAKKLIPDGNVKNLKRPRRQIVEEIDIMGEDLQ